MKLVEVTLAGNKTTYLYGVEKIWLGGLDSNQDNQIQNLMYCQLYDLPTRSKKRCYAVPASHAFFN
jgi:hypothetical protein